MQDSNALSQQDEQLLDFYTHAGVERVGFILNDGAIVEVDNESNDPENSFDVAPEDLITFGDRAIASFHTHPGASAGLSIDDYLAFCAWPHLTHFIVGFDGVMTYRVVGGTVIRAA